MKLSFSRFLATGFLLGAAPLAPAGVNDIPVRAIASVSEREVILDVFVDSGRAPLRGFGFQASFDPGELSFLSGGRYPGLWFLRGENGVSYPYTDVTLPKEGLVRVVGGRLDGNHPREGLAGDGLLLATLVFRRQSDNSPEIELSLASPEPYANFVVDGRSIDEAIVFEKVEVQPVPEDSDQDGLPDKHEIEIYGDLKTSDGDTDTDGDGQRDRDEWLQGTDGSDPNSKFEFEVVVLPDGSKLVTWSSQPNRIHDLLWSSDLGKFTTIAAGIPGSPEPVERLDEFHNRDPEGFYRVRTAFPTNGR